ncbi:universal stress protein [Amycolatopsis cihanbeyliensis]|uniref:Nucleotide-binding universal stress UspA family protein n=1 Tax=Amycolatopsis cihanbeyliensis TaxID=1128664 RepID=A0A542CUQ5_AMYCI|nr:universal stress protein [Amycolatopsis cihanbeyliensis]TQI94549.1 nucleotide-binding universal stress UspA family protein [Amycolatopsis cihanbeyliensis]
MTAYQTVVVGTDGSDSSFNAVDRAAGVAADSGATLVIACAYYPASKQDVEKAQDVLRDEAYQVVGSAPAEDTLQSARDRAARAGATKVETVPVVGEPVESLSKVVTEHSADLLVVGNRGLNTLAGRILGSVPSEVARKSGVDVLIVHTT